MSEWLLGKLGDIAEIVMGQSPTGESVNTDGLGTPLLNGPTEFTIRYPQAVQFSTEPKRFSKVDDILFCVRGSTTGRMNWANASYAIGRGLAAIRHKQGKEYRYFVKAVLDYYLDTMLASASGSTFPNVSKDQLNDLEISYPPLPEQKAIASVLSSLDDKIDLLHRQNKTLEAMAETLFRQWFIEEAKEDWEEVKLGDLCEVITKGTTPKQFLESGVNFIKAESLTDTGSFIRSKFASVSTEIHDTFLKRSILQAGDLLFSIAGTIGRVAKVTADILPANTNQALAILRPKSHVNSDLIYCILKSSYFQELADGKVVHAVQPNLSLGEISNSCIRLPNQKVLQVFIEQVSAYFAKKNVNSSQIQTLENLRDTLLPKLMSGEVRVQYQTEEVI
ncbi:restriction endonuclease subunit S [Acinetobacter ursingii]|uniref:restriction endonuclease subunit S n=1 Tax=Acinetobacter ursingii TaxID=108980 RepID=UPI000CF25F4E|nr:restriction endonuclease subunit S [Acinetobacter ursingii]PPZ95518.1 restriction endonuclease subunit S [Acinetobacter ursingii]